MGHSSAPYVPPAQPDPAAVAAQQTAQNADIATTQTDLSQQDASLQRAYGSAATGSANGMSSVAFTPLGAVAGVR